MSAVDLPVEIWHDILSYLPRGFVRRMLNVSRTLFELGMDEIYREVKLIEGDERTLRLFERIREPEISFRVRSIYIRPSFLPTLDFGHLEDFNNARDHTTLAQRVRHTLHDTGRRLKCHNPIRFGTNTGRQTSTFRRNQLIAKVLATATTAILGCPHLDEFTIILHDCALTPPFSAFLHALLPAVGFSIRKFEIDATLVKITELLKLVHCPSALPALESLSITIATSRFIYPHNSAEELLEVVLKFITFARGSLQALTISEPGILDTSNLFRDLGHLPKLKKLELPRVANSSSLSRVATLGHFLDQNAASLEQLLLKRKSKVCVFGSRPDDTFSKIVEDELPKLTLPALRELDIDCHAPQEVLRLPPFHYLAPNLRKLVVMDRTHYLSYRQFKQLLKNLADCEKHGGALESLYVNLRVFSPDHMDDLALLLPKLRHLEIVYTFLGCNSLEEHAWGWERREARRQFKNRSYKNWKLEYLRVAEATSCGEGHPEVDLCNIIALRIPGLRTIVTDRTCFCYTP